LNFNRHKVLFVIDGLEFGGGERVFLQLASGLRGLFDVSFASSPGGKLEREIKSMGLNFFPVSMKRRFSLKPIFQIKEIVQNKQIELVHSQGLRADFFARIATKLAGAPYNICTIAMPVEGFDLQLMRRKVYRYLDCLTERYVQRFIVVSNSLKRLLIESRGIEPFRVVKIYNGVELQYYLSDYGKDSDRGQFGISQNTILIGAIGRMVWQKGFKYLIQSIPEVIGKIPCVKFLFVGDGFMRKSLERMAENLKVEERIIFTGYRSDIKKILSAIDLLVVPSLLEGFPIITLEGMAMSKPIIATNIDGINEQITNGENGLLVPPGSPESIAEAIIKVSNDSEFADKIGVAARKRVENEFSVEKMVSETENVYRSLLRSN